MWLPWESFTILHEIFEGLRLRADFPLKLALFLAPQDESSPVCLMNFSTTDIDDLCLLENICLVSLYI